MLDDPTPRWKPTPRYDSKDNLEGLNALKEDCYYCLRPITYCECPKDL